MTEFQQPAMNERYLIAGTDRKIMIPGRYTGLLSDITDAQVIEEMISRKSNLVTRKPVKQNTAKVKDAAVSQE